MYKLSDVSNVKMYDKDTNKVVLDYDVKKFDIQAVPRIEKTLKVIYKDDLVFGETDTPKFNEIVFYLDKKNRKAIVKDMIVETLIEENFDQIVETAKTHEDKLVSYNYNIE